MSEQIQMREFSDDSGSRRADVYVQYGIKIPMRDGIQLAATLYTPRNHREPTPALVSLTPYTAQMWHEFGVYFAEHGYPFLVVDVRGRGNSEGVFMPFVHEGEDGYDVVEWVAKQPYCNQKVATWGGSYAAFAQWALAKESPPHLATIVPVASAYIGVDMPIQCNIATPYLMQWLTLVSGRTSQDRLFFNSEAFWGSQFRRWFEAGVSFRELDTFLGNPSPIFQEWITHPRQDDYWDRCNPTTEQYAGLSIPVLTITGIYDSDQSGALTHHRMHLKHASNSEAQHYLVVGPWDHFGTRIPKAEFCGVRVGPASLVDLRQLHLQWYGWIMKGESKPDFLQKKVAYYAMGAEKWRYADTIEAVTSGTETLFLHSSGPANDVFHSGSLTSKSPVTSEGDSYIYDPRDVTHADLESTVDPENRADQRMVLATIGKQLIYHSEPFQMDTEVSGYFRLSLWISIDQTDTDFRASVYDIDIDGSSIALTIDSIRARHRINLRDEQLIRTKEPLRYDFERFTFVSRVIKKGNRLRLVVGPINSIYSQKNYNSGGVVSDESMRHARPVTVTVYHDQSHPSALSVPLGHLQSSCLSHAHA